MQDSLALLQATHPSALLDGQMYEDLLSRSLLTRCLDTHCAAAVAGWPAEDTLHQLRSSAAHPSRQQVLALMQAIDSRTVARSLRRHSESRSGARLPFFALYQFRSAGSARSGIDSLRRGLVMLGYGMLQRWLSDQLPHADGEVDPHPCALPW